MQNFEQQYHAFTIKSMGIARQLKSEIVFFANGKSICVPGIWDTGATNTCISMQVANDLGLVSTGQRIIQTPSGSKLVNTYLVDIGLPNKVGVRGACVCDSDIGDQGIGALIGMDIISKGDFSVSNYDGKTVFTFRTPSKQITDYAAQITAENIIGQKHGKGKRKRK